MKKKEDKCPVCEGHGEAAFMCGECDPARPRRSCPDCRGTGYVKETCDWCRGKDKG